MQITRAKAFVVVGAVAAAAVATVTLSANAVPTFVSELTFSPDNPARDSYGYDTSILGDVSVAADGYLDFFGRSVVQTSDRPDLNPGVADFTFGARIALTRGVGNWNVMQKGYWGDDQWKLSTHKDGSAARLSCRFSGSRGAVHVFTDNPVIAGDGSWHDVACVRTGDTVRIRVDGNVVAEGTGPIGSITSTKPYLIGSKGMDMADPDQYLGLIDDAYVIRDDDPPPPPRINHPPKADVSVLGCDKLRCTFDASGSADPDGDPLDYTWDFGDGAGGNGVQASHAFDADGTYPVKVTVQDGSATASASLDVKVSSSDPKIDFRASSGAVADAKAISVVVPPSVDPGDTLLLVVAANKSAPTLKAPTGWQTLGRQVDDSMQSVLWRHDAIASDAGSKVEVTSSGAAVMTATLVGYSSTSAAPPAVTALSSAEDRRVASHTTPTTSTGGGSWVVSIWADRSADTSSWQVPASVATRQFLATTGAGHVTSLVADSAGAVGAGAVGGATATASSPSYVATSWTVVLSPG